VFLVEMIAVISISVVLLGLSVVLLQSLLKLESRRRDDLLTTTTLNRLARDLRADVRAGRSARVEVLPVLFAGGGGAGRLEVDRGDGRLVSYKAEPEGIVREEPRRGRELYRLPRGWEMRWEIGEGLSPVISAEIRRPAVAAGRAREGTAAPTRIEAILGRDHRYTAGGGS
jgi:hypothetical protein